VNLGTVVLMSRNNGILADAPKNDIYESKCFNERVLYRNIQLKDALRERRDPNTLLYLIGLGCFLSSLDQRVSSDRIFDLGRISCWG